jgi:hypothetical protein
MHLIRRRRIVSLLKMLIRQNVWRTALLRWPTHAEHLRSVKIRCEVPLTVSGTLGRDLLFLR